MKKKEKAIIALYGPEDTGKTTTLRKLALEFLDSPEVEEDIQVGFLYYKENEKKPTKIVVSTIKDPRANVAFYTGLMAQTLILVTTTRIKDQTGEINVVVKLEKKEDADPGQEKIDDKLKLEIKELISSIAQEGTATLRQFLLRLLQSEVVEGDIQIAFRYKGKKIVVSTAGDTKKVVKESIDLFEVVDADILVTATRDTETRAYGALRNYEKGIKAMAIWMPKSGCEATNERQVETLRSFIDLLSNS